MANNLYYTSKFSGEEIDDAVSRVLETENTNAVATKNELKTKADLVDGKVPASQLPSYVDDAIEGYFVDNKFYANDNYTEEIQGEAGKVYIDKKENKTYRWGGSTYVSLNDVDMTNYPTKAEMEKALKDKADTKYVDGLVGDIETALDGIISIQNSLIGGDA